MSNLWRHAQVESAASVGSFVIHRSAASFKAWGSNDDEAHPDAPIVPSTEDIISQRELAAYAQGLADGRATVEAELAAERDAVARLAEALPDLKAEPMLPLGVLIAETVQRLVREIVGEVEINLEHLVARASSASLLIGETTQPAKLRVHPLDAPTLAAADLELEVEADPTLERGAILIETANGWIEDGPAQRLERLRARLDQVAATR